MPAPDRFPPLVIAHRGASGYRPERTLEAYALAVAQGADFIEPDLVSTRDGVLVARHENEISGTTDVALKFPARRTSRVIDGAVVEGWFTEDFTLAELKTLRARERLPFRSHAFDGQFEIPTFEEILQLVARLEAETGHRIGLYPETKHPSYFRSIGLPLEEPLLSLLHGHGYTGADDPVFLQSFETDNLRQLHRRTGLRLIQLLDEQGAPWDLAMAGDARGFADLARPEGLRGIAEYADGIGPGKRLIVPVASDGSLAPPTTLVRAAHDAGLLVHPWTFRSEAPFLHAAYGGDPGEEFQQFFSLGVDGVFADGPDLARAAVERLGR